MRGPGSHVLRYGEFGYLYKVTCKNGVECRLHILADDVIEDDTDDDDDIDQRSGRQRIIDEIFEKHNINPQTTFHYAETDPHFSCEYDHYLHFKIPEENSNDGGSGPGTYREPLHVCNKEFGGERCVRERISEKVKNLCDECVNELSRIVYPMYMICRMSRNGYENTTTTTTGIIDIGHVSSLCRHMCISVQPINNADSCLFEPKHEDIEPHNTRDTDLELRRERDRESHRRRNRRRRVREHDGGSGTGTSHHHHVVDDVVDDDAVVEALFNEQEIEFVPARSSAINALETVEASDLISVSTTDALAATAAADGTCCSSCVICLEDLVTNDQGVGPSRSSPSRDCYFVGGDFPQKDTVICDIGDGGRVGQVVRMPCSHLFHQPCIAQWLKTSHFCTTCRFQMPVYSRKRTRS